ncbi:MAG: DUF4276 family protein [Fimbriimonadaceae bacterium]|nr:DUF4276 family protein [Fimbriimonadaceae bacterium]
MVVCMETWLLADEAALRTHWRARFQDHSALRRTDLETLAKPAVLQSLRAIGGGDYHKIRDGAAILALLNPATVRPKAPACDRALLALEGLAATDAGC